MDTQNIDKNSKAQGRLPDVACSASYAWTDVVPTVPGWYFQRDGDGCVRVLRFPGPPPGWPTHWRDRKAESIAVADESMKERIAAIPDSRWMVVWAGPIPLPNAQAEPRGREETNKTTNIMDSNNTSEAPSRAESAQASCSAFLASVTDYCPETGEPQKLAYVGGTENGHDHLTVITRGKSTAWKHTIITEEMDPDNLPQMPNDQSAEAAHTKTKKTE